MIAVALALVSVAVAGVAIAQPTPVGPEFQINVVTTGSQFNPDVCIDQSGNFVVVWDGDSSGAVRMRLYDAAGVPATGELTVSTSATQAPNVACEPDGDFVVTWPDGGEVFARRYDAAGMALGGAFQVNDYTTGFQWDPEVAVNASGEFVIAWTDRSARDGSEYGVFARRFDASGLPDGADFAVNSYTTGRQERPAVDLAPTGEFVVVWRDDYRPEISAYAVTGQLFDSAGGQTGSEFIVNTEPSGLSRGILDVSVTPGGFVVAWPGLDYDFYKRIFSRRFDSSASPLAGVFQVDTSDRYPEYARVDADAGGNFVVAWTDYRYDGDGDYGVFARTLEADDTPRSGVFLVNSETVGFQGDFGPGLAVAPNGDFVVVWHSGEDQDGDGYGIFGQRFSNPLPPGACAAAPLDDCLRPVVPLKAKLSIKNDADDRHDRLGWKWVRGEETTQADLGDPTGGDDYAVCLYDASGALIFEAAVPAGGTCGSKPCWKGLGTPAGTKGYKYKDRDRTPNGVLKVVAKVGPEGKAKVVVKAGGDNLDTALPGLPTSPIVLPARMQLQRTGGVCWEAVYEQAGASLNDGGQFIGRGS